MVDGGGFSGDSNEDSSRQQLPPWLLSAPSDIPRLSVEKRFPDAVALILRCRVSIRSIVESAEAGKGDHLLKQRAEEALDLVEREVPAVVQGILKALSRLPISPLFGSESQFRLLRLLVALGEDNYSQAVQGFAILQVHEPIFITGERGI